MSLTNLKFFNKKGHELTPILSDGIYKLSIALDPVSVGLFETEHIFIFEEVFKRVDKQQSPDLNLNPSSTDLLYRFLKSIQSLLSSNTKPTEEHLKGVFTLDDITKQSSVFQYAKRNQNYVSIDFDFEYFYGLTVAGIDYLATFENDLEDERLAKLGYKKYLVKPRTSSDEKVGEISQLLFKWNKPSLDDSLYLFGLSENSEMFHTSTIDDNFIKEPFPVIIPYKDKDIDFKNSNDWKKLSENYIFDYGITDEYYVGGIGGINSRRILKSNSVLNQNPFQVNVTANSDTEGTHTRTLEIFVHRKRKNFQTDSFHNEVFRIAEIEFYFEFVEEENRFKKVLENFGRRIEDEDFYVFRDYDLDDDLLDYIKINEKRKELLLEGDTIFNHLGSYKSLRSVFKWLGYKDIEFREYFYNIRQTDPSKNKIVYSSVDFPVDFQDDIKFKKGSELYPFQKYGHFLLDDDWKKTTRYGIIYKYNEYIGEDDYGDPVTNNKVNFSPEEVLVKLYGLKKFLYKYFLPHNARIINITAEGIYFTRVVLNTWTDFNKSVHVRKRPNFDFTTINPISNKENIFDLITSFCYKNLQQNDRIKDWVNIDNPEDNDLLKNYKDFPLKTFMKGDYFTYTNPEVVQEYKKDLVCERIEEIVNHYLYEYNTYEVLQEKFRKAGLFVLDMIVDEIAIGDLTASFAFFETEAGNCHVNTNGRNEDVELDEQNMIERRFEDGRVYRLCGPEYPSTRYTLGTFFYVDSDVLEWVIEHETGEYVITQKGHFKDIQRIYALLPLKGFYHVTLRVIDETGFPLTKKKLNFLEVRDVEPDIIAFGRFVVDGTLGDFENYTIGEWEGTLNNERFCPLESRIDECDIEIDSLRYANYLNQEYFHPYLKQTSILNIDYPKRQITLETSKLHTDFHLYKKNFKNDLFKVLFVNEGIIKYTDGKLLDIIKNKIYLYNPEEIKKGENIAIYEKYETKRFSIFDDNKIRITDPDFYNLFEPGTLIEMIQDSPGFEHHTKLYFIEDVFIDENEKFAILTIQDDGSLDFNNAPAIRNNLGGYFKYLFKNWSTLVYRTRYHLFKVSDYWYDGDIDNYVVQLLGNWQTLKKLDLTKLYCEYGIIKGIYEFEISDNDIVLNSDNTVTLDLHSDDFCYIDTNFKAVWSEFDILRAKRNSKFDLMSFKTLENLTFEEMENQTIGLTDFHTTPITGFRLYNIQKLDPAASSENQSSLYVIPKGKIKIRTLLNEYEEYEIALPRFEEEMTEINPEQQITQWKYKKVVEYLNSLTEGILSNYYFFSKGTEYIQAVQKTEAVVPFFTINTEIIKCRNKNNFPQYNWYENSVLEFKNINNPPLYLHHANNYLNNENNPKNEIKNDELHWSMNGSFTFADSFIKKTEFQVPSGTPVFFVCNRKSLFNKEQYSFEWVLYDEVYNRILSRSSEEYITWLFDEKGVYSLELEIKNLKVENDVKIIKKKSFIEIR